MHRINRNWFVSDRDKAAAERFTRFGVEIARWTFAGIVVLIFLRVVLP